MNNAQIASSAVIHPDATIGPDVSIGEFSIVHNRVQLGAGARVESHCVLGRPTDLAREDGALILGDGAYIRSHSVFYQGSQFGAGLVTGHRVTVREGMTVGIDCQLGTLCDLQGDCQFGDHVRLHSSVHVGKHSTLGDFVWLYPYVVLTNDPHPPSEDDNRGPTIGDFAVVATMSTILPRVTVGVHSLVGAHSLVRHDVAPHTVVGGVPARELGDLSRIKLDSGEPAYPWPRHFRRGYPPEATNAWSERF